MTGLIHEYRREDAALRHRIAILVWILATAAGAATEEPRVAEDVYRGEMASYPGPWAFSIPKPGIILVSDAELETLAADPEKTIDLSLVPGQKHIASLRQMCEAAKNQGARTLMVAFDHFFQQYRPGQHHARRLMPDMDAYIEKIARIGKFAEQYGLGLELSLITPLEIGRAYREATGESGVWMQYRKGLRDPVGGAYSVQLWRHTRWTNNKGPFDLEDAGVRVFAFRERPVGGTPCRVVPEEAITEITDTAKVEVLEGIHAKGFPATRVRVYGTGKTEMAGLNRVLVVQMYRTPEMDLLVQAKRHAEQRMGHRLEARGHATWAESPTCDHWVSFAGVNSNRQKYEYTSDYLWSNTIQQHAVACSDYFRWGDFLTGNGNDHAEGGFLDRNYRPS